MLLKPSLDRIGPNPNLQLGAYIDTADFQISFLFLL